MDVELKGSEKVGWIQLLQYRGWIWVALRMEKITQSHDKEKCMHYWSTVSFSRNILLREGHKGGMKH